MLMNCNLWTLSNLSDTYFLFVKLNFSICWMKVNIFVTLFSWEQTVFIIVQQVAWQWWDVTCIPFTDLLVIFFHLPIYVYFEFFKVLNKKKIFILFSKTSLNSFTEFLLYFYIKLDNTSGFFKTYICKLSIVVRHQFFVPDA